MSPTPSMPAFIHAIVRNGQLVLASPLALPDGTTVTVRVEGTANAPLLQIAAQAVDMGVSDGAEQHDHYVYGTSRQAE